MSEETEKEVVEQVYTYAIQLKNAGQSDLQIRDALIEKGLDKESSNMIVDNINKSVKEESGGGGGILIWIAILIGINVLSAMFDWPFWIY